MLIVLLVTMLGFVPAFIQWHGRWLWRLEDPEVNGFWVVGYEVWKPGYDYSRGLGEPGWQEAWDKRVYFSDLATVRSHDLAGAEGKVKEHIAKEYPTSDFSIRYCFYHRNKETV